MPNRNDIRQLLQSHLNGAMNGQESCILLIDLDGFHKFNEAYGHRVADDILQEASVRLKRVCDKHSILGRIAGDEFVIIRKNVSPSDMDSFCQSIHAQFRELFTVADITARVTVCIGIACSPIHGTDMDTLLAHATTALREAKHFGRDTVQMYVPTQQMAPEHAIQMEVDLLRAIETDEFQVYLQPRVHAITKQVVAAEALTRWNHPTLGLLTPGQFIPLAEETGLILPLTELVMKKAASWLREYAMENSLTISINISPQHFHKLNIASTMEQIAANYGIATDRLEVELTESALFRSATEVSHTLQSCAELGVSVALDDFGTGHSSLARLHALSIDYLKIDPSFIWDIGVSQSGEAIVSAIVDLAKRLNLKVIAEGVETREQERFLQNLGCDQLQGYLYSVPLPAPQFADFLAQY